MRRGIAVGTTVYLVTEEMEDSSAKWEKAVCIIMDLSDGQVEDVIQEICNAACTTKEQIAAALHLPMKHTLTLMPPASREVSTFGSMTTRSSHRES